MKKTFDFYGKSMVVEDISSVEIRKGKVFTMISNIYGFLMLLLFIGMVIVGISENAGYKFYAFGILFIIGSLVFLDFFGTERIIEVTFKNGNKMKSETMSQEAARLMKIRLLEKVNG